MTPLVDGFIYSWGLRSGLAAHLDQKKRSLPNGKTALLIY
ncbi:hypothetical protein SapgrDRAFT_0204 [Saprospira grandis DSM 2844]|uniref:Uncharacterized protein n=1 Tax=Saprospira grandis DSM 2844 TaxID=694433 RepID=J0NWT0_9BACT|nr:hypothetical protein SapgrDRAFT_0204 [Saprospira grandis DSM 2844]